MEQQALEVSRGPENSLREETERHLRLAQLRQKLADSMGIKKGMQI